MADSVKCVRDIRDIPPEKYRLWFDKASAHGLEPDGRKWRQQCADRQKLAWLLATFADGDGSSIMASVGRLAKAVAWSERKTKYVLAELAALGFLESGKRSKFQGTRVRTLNVSTIVQDSPVSSVGQDSPVGQDSRPIVQDSPSVGQDSRPVGQRMRCTRPTTRTDQHTGQPTGQRAGWLATLDLGKPNKEQKATLEELEQAHGFELLKAAILRGKSTLDFGGMKFPWAKLTPELPRLIEEVGKDHGWRMKHDTAYADRFNAAMEAEAEAIREANGLNKPRPTRKQREAADAESDREFEEFLKQN